MKKVIFMILIFIKVPSITFGIIMDGNLSDRHLNPGLNYWVPGIIEAGNGMLRPGYCDKTNL
jgi:hypothetical protein